MNRGENSPSGKVPIGKVTLCGELVEHAGMDMRAFRYYDNYGMVYIYRGHGRYEDDSGQSLSVPEGSLIYLWPGLGHRYASSDGLWSEVYFLFEGPVFALWQRSGLWADLPRVRSLGPVEVWAERFRDILRLAKQGEGEQAGELRVVCELQRIWAETALETPPRAEAGWAGRACQLIRSRIAEPDCVRQAAVDLGMGYESFRKRFVRDCGISPGQFQVRERLVAAAMKLESGSQPVGQIAEALGFCDAFHFSRQFSRRFGCSPLRYRQRQQSRQHDAYPTQPSNK